MPEQKSSPEWELYQKLMEEVRGTVALLEALHFRYSFGHHWIHVTGLVKVVINKLNEENGVHVDDQGVASVIRTDFTKRKVDSDPGPKKRRFKGNESIANQIIPILDYLPETFLAHEALKKLTASGSSCPAKNANVWISYGLQFLVQTGVLTRTKLDRPNGAIWTYKKIQNGQSAQNQQAAN